MNGPTLASRVNSIQMSGIRSMLELARPGSLHLGLGESDFEPPAVLLEALAEALSQGHNRYSSTAGLPALREAIAAYESSKRSADIAAEQVLVTIGGTEALTLAALALVEPGQEVLIPGVGFVLYEGMVRLAGAKPVRYPLDHEGGFVPDPAEVAELISPRTAALLVNTPSNPTGACFPAQTVRALKELAQDHGLALISDEVYDRMVFDFHHTFFEGDEPNLIYVNSFTKLFAITGWRLGWTLAAPETIEGLVKLHYHLISCPPTPLQHAVLKGLEEFPADWVANMLATYRDRRDLMVGRLNKIKGFDCHLPGGAFYAFPRYSQPIPSLELARRIAAAGVICTPGSVFGPDGEGHLRFSYATATETIEAALDIVAEVMEGL